MKKIYIEKKTTYGNFLNRKILFFNTKDLKFYISVKCISLKINGFKKVLVTDRLPKIHRSMYR